MDRDGSGSDIKIVQGLTRFVFGGENQRPFFYELFLIRFPYHTFILEINHICTVNNIFSKRTVHIFTYRCLLVSLTFATLLDLYKEVMILSLGLCVHRTLSRVCCENSTSNSRILGSPGMQEKVNKW